MIEAGGRAYLDEPDENVLRVEDASFVLFDFAIAFRGQVEGYVFWCVHTITVAYEHGQTDRVR